MSEELKYMGTTKKVLWDAYKDKKAELEKLKGGEPVSTVEKAEKENVNRSIGTATSIQINDLEKTLTEHVNGITSLKKEYDDLVTAINAKKEELKEVHEIEVSANDLAALAAVKEGMIKETNERAEETKAEAEKIKTDAHLDYKETMDKLREEIKETRENEYRENNRKKEEYEYNFKRHREKAMDKVNDELEKLRNSLNERVNEVSKREELAEEKDAKIKELTDSLETLKKELQEKMDAAFTKGEEKAKKSAQYQANIVKASTDAKMEIARAKIHNLEEKIEKLEEQIEQANSRVAIVNSQIAEMAQSALKAQGDVKTIEEVSKIAAGSQKK